VKVRRVSPEAAGWGSAAVGPWTRHERRIAYQNAWITVYHDDVATPTGTAGIYGVVHFANTAVGVVAVDEHDRVVLVGQHRYTVDEMSWEIPEGGSPLGEDTLGGARRELREETGLKAKKWQPIGRFHLSNSISDEEAFLYLATELTRGLSAPDETEDLDVRWVDFETALSMIDSGEITDAMSVIGLQRVALQRR
jgi:8-oxo-dGTP pyrophosphatase MutT (NUDIX family)